MDFFSNNILSIYLSVSAFIFLCVIVYKRKKIRDRRNETTNQITLILKYAVMSNLFALLVPIMIIAPEGFAGFGGVSFTSSDSDVLDSEYSKTEAFTSDMLIIGVICLVFSAFVGAIIFFAA